jgi:hypothetical protein
MNTEKLRNAGGNQYIFLLCYEKLRLLLADDWYMDRRSRRTVKFPVLLLRRPAFGDEAAGTQFLYYP